MSRSVSAAHNCWEGAVWAFTARSVLQGGPLGRVLELVVVVVAVANR